MREHVIDGLTLLVLGVIAVALYMTGAKAMEREPAPVVPDTVYVTDTLYVVNCQGYEWITRQRVECR
jgi:hypothetical protein